MSYAPTENPNYLPTTVQQPKASPGFLVKLFRTIGSTLQQEYARRRDLTNLSELDDYMLRDMGIGRSEIDNVVGRPWGRRND